MSTDPARRLGIARLVAAGHMTRESPGVYVDKQADDEGRSNLPDYDYARIMIELPHLLEMVFDENTEGCFVRLRDGSMDASQDGELLILGADLPETTDDLVELIQAHYMGQLDMDAMDEADDIFDEIADS